MLKPVFIQTPQEHIISYVIFHDGSEQNRKEATVSLLTQADLKENGDLIRSDISYVEIPLTQLPDSLQEILREDLPTITNDSIVIMRLFEKKENGEIVPMFLHDQTEIIETNDE